MSSPQNQQRSGESADRAITAYRRPRGSVGVRNHILVAPSVICSHVVAQRIADSTEGAVATPHDHGCAQIGADHEQTERTLRNVARNPNVAGTLVVGLGCEHLQSDHLADEIGRTDVPVREVSIQAAGGTECCREDGRRLAAELAAEVAAASESQASLSDLTVGIVSSDLDASTVETASPLVGGVVNELTEAGGRAVVAGTERLVPHADRVVGRAATDGVAEGLETVTDRITGRPGNVRRITRRASDASFDDIVGHWGDAPVTETVAYGERASADSGLVVVDTPSRFEEATTALAAAGASIVLHLTADGITTGHPLVPVIKLTGDAATAELLADDIDIDAGSAAVSDVLETVRRVADGERTAAERHGLTKFAMSRCGPSQ